MDAGDCNPVKVIAEKLVGVDAIAALSLTSGSWILIMKICPPWSSGIHGQPKGVGL